MKCILYDQAPVWQLVSTTPSKLAGSSWTLSTSSSIELSNLKTSERRRSYISRRTHTSR
eukprot:COSAG02_NODE_46173_length_351_cov_0.753968_1_plen_58_part_01